jgi:superfamily II DNA or RNA helicase
MTGPTDDLLSPGRVVTVRDRLWRVDRVEGPEFSATPLDGRDTTSRRFHALLEHVSPGESPDPTPASLGSFAEQATMLDAFKLSMLHGTAPILGLQRSRAIPTDYQLVPLLLTMGRDRARLLIADDVGSGKTIEAGLVLAELLARGMARRILVVVPANLRGQWADALDHFFHIDSTVVAGHLLPALERRLLPGQSVWTAHDVVVASFDYLKTRTDTVLEYGWDAVVIDEAHLCGKPHTLPGAPAPDMARWRFAQEAARRSRHLLLLTATPHNGYTDSYASLLQMLSEELVIENPDGSVTVRRQIAKDYVVQRRRRDIEAWYEARGRKSPFPRRKSDEHLIDLRGRGNRDSDLKVLLRDLGGYADALFSADTTRPINGWVAAHLQKRALSSPNAIQVSLKNRLNAVSSAATSEAPRRSRAETEARASVADLFDSVDASDEEQSDRLDVVGAGLGASEEIEYLERLHGLAKKVTPAKDPKLAYLAGLIPTRVAAHPDAPRVMVFTKYKDTLDYIVKNLASAPKVLKDSFPENLHVFAIDGGLTLAERLRVFREFERAAPAVLVATDCISEGLNLQHACAEIIHYELPWNPNRLEQRNGRVDRFGQREEFVGVNTLVLDDDLDALLLELIVKKAEQMHAEYGFVPPFLANADILSHLSASAARHRIAPTLFEAAAAQAMEEAASDRSKALIGESVNDQDLLDHAKTETIRDECFYGHANVSLSFVEEALERSRRETGSEDAVTGFVTATLAQFPGLTVDTDEHGIFTINGTADELAGVLPKQGRRLSFRPADGFADPDIDVIDIAHPLLRRLVDVIRDKAAHPDAAGRVAARTSPATDRVTAVGHLLVRYVANADPPVLMEELVPVALPVWGDAPDLDPARLLEGTPGEARSAAEVREAAAAALGHPNLKDTLNNLSARRAEALSVSHGSLDAPWAAGLSNIEVMSRDLLALTIIWPADPA